VQPLQAVKQHRTVDFAKDVLSNFDDEVGPDADDVVVEGGVMQFAQGNPVGNDGITTRVSVRNDVGSVEQLFVTKWQSEQVRW
jgi:hypothetical protein